MASSEKMSIEEIEAGLERLMPRGLTEDTRLELEGVVEDLAEGADNVRGESFWRRPLAWQAAAAVLIAGVGVSLFLQTESQNLPDSGFVKTGIARDGFEVLGQRTWVEAGSGMGALTIDESEEVSQGWSYSGIQEERVLDADSGYEVILQRNFDADVFSASSL